MIRQCIEAKARFMPTGIDSEVWEMYSDQQKNEHVDWTPFVFFVDSIEAWNKSNEGLTTIRTKSGDSFTVDIGFRDFKNKIDFFTNQINKP